MWRATLALTTGPSQPATFQETTLTRSVSPMRFGLVGTGPWAHKVHGPGLVRAEVELTGVWGRSPEKALALAADLGVAQLESFDDLLGAVDAVALAVPPDVQAELALRAAQAGKHLLLDKPVSTDPAQARELARVAEANGVGSVVYFTDRFTESGSAWFAEVVEAQWQGGSVTWLSSLDSPDNPYGASAWRRERGAMWDVGPHAVATLDATLGPATGVTAVAGARDLVHLVLRHESGATSTATMSLFAPPAAVTHQTRIWGPSGTEQLPGRVAGEEVGGFARAAQELADSVAAGRPHPCDLRLGVRVTELLAQAERQVSG